MKKSMEEQIKEKLLRLGKKNKVLRVVMLPVLFVCVTFFHTCYYFKNNDVMSFSCRRIVDNEIRNVIVDIIRSKDYEEDFQLVYIYIKVIE